MERVMGIGGVFFKARDGAKLAAWYREHLGIEVGQTTPDGAYTLETAECLAACDQAPVIMVGRDRIGPVRPEDVERRLTGRRPQERV